MSYKPTYIADLNSGLVRDKEAFLIPQDAFPELTNAYIWRGRIKRRLGFETLGRLRRNLTVAAAGNYSTIVGTNVFNIFTGLGLAATEPDAEVVLGSLSNITIVFAAPIGQSLTDASNTGVMVVVGAGPITAASINYATGDITITATAVAGPAVTTVSLSYYPMLPVMDLSVREVTANNNEDLIAFDTKYAYIFNNGIQQFQEWIPGTTWSGSNSQFFWTTNYWQDAADVGLFWETNNNPGATGDPIRYTNGTVWTTFNPILRPNATATPPRLQQCLMLLPFKDRLLAFNTWEGTTLANATQFPQRVRFSQNGDPTVLGAIAAGAPFGWTTVGAWSDDTPGKGGFIDAPTNEFIVSVAYLRDILIVGFERSTWQLRYTGNEILPFVWERINSDLGVESTFSPVQLDDQVVAVGNVAIQTSNGNQCQRIDLQIPDEVFNFHNANEGQIRVHGIRDYFRELIYWNFPNAAQDGLFPNRMLVYNYRNSSFAFFDESFTCFGAWQRTNDAIWNQYIVIGEDEWVNQPYSWASPQGQSFISEVVAGNQIGYVLMLNQHNGNGPSLSIRDIASGIGIPALFTLTNHNLSNGDVIVVQGALGTIQGIFNGIVGSINNKTYEVNNVTPNTFTLKYMTNTGILADLQTIGTYIGGGEIEFVNRIDVRSKKFQALQEGSSIKLGYVDALTDVTAFGQFTLNVYADYNDSNPINETNDDFFNNVVLTTLEDFQMEKQTKSWHRAFSPSRSQFYQFQITLSNAQLFDPIIANSDLVVYALILWADAGGRLI